MSAQSDVIVQKVLNRLMEAFGKPMPESLGLATAKALDYVTGKRGRKGGTFATETGLKFADLVTETNESNVTPETSDTESRSETQA